MVGGSGGGRWGGGCKVIFMSNPTAVLCCDVLGVVTINIVSDPPSIIYDEEIVLRGKKSACKLILFYHKLDWH